MTGTWFPVVHHLTDSAAMAGELFDTYLPASTKATLSTLLGVPQEQVRTLGCFMAGVHDNGKITPSFAAQASHRFPEVLARMKAHGLDADHPYPGRFKHATLGQVALIDWLTRRFPGERPAILGYGSIVGGHHGRNPSSTELRQAESTPTALGTGPWATVRDEVLDGMASLTGAVEYWPEWVNHRPPAAAQSLLTGLVIMADWMASNQEYFPYLDDLPTDERLARASERLALPRPWRPERRDGDATDLLHRRFPQLATHPARSIQSALVDAARAAKAPPLLIVEAPMGVGKTEAALLAAEVLAARFGQGGIFLGLPTMATANPMFTRALRWLNALLSEAFPGDDVSVALTHGKAGLNDEYAGLIREAWRGELHDEDAPDAARAVVNMWLRGAKRAGLASFVIGTIDQALFGALKAKHVTLRHLALSNKVVIIDEVHSADVYMRQYLNRLLTWLSALGVPVILMSATLPPAQREGFVRAYALGRGDRRPEAPDPSDAYPRITAYDSATTNLAVAEEGVGITVQVKRIGDDPGDLTRLLGDLLIEGGCAGVVCNTVRRAQETYDAVLQRFPADEVVLVHSRFLAPDRVRREASLVDRLGSAGARPERLIVIGTQVLEQSLDIDFDVLVSDLAPIDLLLQRVGRLHRHARGGRPARLAEPVLHLRGVDDWDTQPPALARSTTAIYGRAASLRAAAVLVGRTALTLPQDIPRLVRQGYDPELAAPTGWEVAWADAERAARTEEARRKQNAEAFLLAAPQRLGTLDGWIDVNSGDPDRAEQQGHAQVRDSEDTIEVIVVERVDGALRLPASAAHSHAPIPEHQPWGTGSDAPVARAMSACTLRLPRELCHDGIVEPLVEAIESMVDASGWQDSPWLRGQLVLPFDADGNARIDIRGGPGRQNVSHNLHYDFNRGLTVE